MASGRPRGLCEREGAGLAAPARAGSMDAPRRAPSPGAARRAFAPAALSARACGPPLSDGGVGATAARSRTSVGSGGVGLAGGRPEREGGGRRGAGSRSVRAGRVAPRGAATAGLSRARLLTSRRVCYTTRLPKWGPGLTVPIIPNSPLV